MKIKKDNLSPKEKKNAYISIFILVLIIIAFFVYKKEHSDYREKLLSKNTELTSGKIIGNSTYKTTHNYVEYEVNGKKFETRRSSSRIFNIGEIYEIKYSKSNPEISEVDYTKPIIFDKNKFETINGIITKTYENDRLSVLSFSYKYGNEKYERDVILEKIGGLKKGNQIRILVKRNNPKISYLEK